MEKTDGGIMKIVRSWNTWQEEEEGKRPEWATVLGQDDKRYRQML